MDSCYVALVSDCLIVVAYNTYGRPPTANDVGIHGYPYQQEQIDSAFKLNQEIARKLQFQQQSGTQTIHEQMAQLPPTLEDITRETLALLRRAHALFDGIERGSEKPGVNEPDQEGVFVMAEQSRTLANALIARIEALSNRLGRL